MKILSIGGWTLVILAVLLSSAAPGLAFRSLHLAPVPEDPTLVLVALGGAAVAWQYFRSRVRR